SELAGKRIKSSGGPEKLGGAPRETPALHNTSANPGTAGADVIMKTTSISTHCRTILLRTRKYTFAPLLSRLTISQPKPTIFDPVTLVVAFRGVTAPAVTAPSIRLPLLRNPRLVSIIFPPQVVAHHRPKRRQ